jgi:hypothetical protein
MTAPVVRTIFSPAHGKSFRLGRKRPVAKGAHFKLGNYLHATLPTPPSTCDYSLAARGVLVDVYDNDALGDCVIAGGYHIVGTETGNAGNLYHANSEQIVADYHAIGGYVPGDSSTDQGCDEVTALNYWTEHGFANGSKLLGWATVDATKPEQVRLACYLFENLFFGIALPDPWLSPFPSSDGFVWDVAGNPDYGNGHCVVGVGYNTRGVIIDTWGMLGTLTFEAIAKYAVDTAGGQLYVMLSPDQCAKAATKAPNGVAWADLIADFQAMGGNAPVTPPAPPPPPAPPAPPAPPRPPAPPATVTLAHAKAWATRGIKNAAKHGNSSLSVERAVRAADKGLEQSWPK